MAVSVFFALFLFFNYMMEMGWFWSFTFECRCEVEAKRVCKKRLYPEKYKLIIFINLKLVIWDSSSLDEIKDKSTVI